ncbi:purine-nucleoside phosphorylase [Halalkalibaculum sp. DA384]|uniref:purine-nucleoside phosphorylase n=1 Tax=Halalkalibaculum sp. DA384 TaxID=3373606 RepID=UPI003754478D
MPIPDYISEITRYLYRKGVPDAPTSVIILGSGLGDFTGQIDITGAIPYADIPRFPTTSVEGHRGNLICGKVGSSNVIAFSGRFHHYEGFSFEQTALPVYLARALDAEKLIISNAAGAINTTFSVGDLMVIEDIIRQNHAVSPTGHAKFRYSHRPWVDRVRKLAAERDIVTRQGTYLYAKGPNYETKAEIRAFRTMGADAVGMSTVPELTEAARLGIKTVAISLISNMATGVNHGKLSHEEVAEAAGLRTTDFSVLIKALIKML